MYLTLAKLWVAGDKCACAHYPLLTQYDSEVDLTEFQCLTLPHKDHMECLHTVERHVNSRRDRVTNGLPSVFRNFGDGSSFATRYFNQSKALQATLENIEADAATKRRQKHEELAAVKTEYHKYRNYYNTTGCQTQTVVTNHYHGYTEEVHSVNCTRCANKARADCLEIRIREWPVLSDPSIAKATVFELMVPETYSNWRDATVYFISTVLECRETELSPPRASYMLNKHHDLSHLLSGQYAQRRVKSR
jgi:hypothetical protein